MRGMWEWGAEVLGIERGRGGLRKEDEKREMKEERERGKKGREEKDTGGNVEDKK